LERATHTNISEQQRQFYIDTLMAILTSYEQELTYKLLMDSELQEGYYCKFTVDALTRADIKTRYEAYRTGISAGFLTPNEVRAWEELPPAEGGDQLLVNGNVVPIEDAGAAYRDKKGGGGD
jgi:HK97 family phage portal protein